MDFEDEKKSTVINSKDILSVFIYILLIIFAVSWVYLTSAPNVVNTATTFEIEEGSSLKKVTEDLKEQGIIRSRSIANLLVIFSSGDGSIVSGEYLFDKKEDLFSVLKRITNGDFGIDAKQVLIPEGSTVRQMGLIFEEVYEDFDKEIFYQLAEGKEGYLFPDTYLFLENVKAEEVFTVLEETFYEKVNSIEEDLIDSGRTLEEVIKMASIIEKEADATSRQEVSDILWHRLNIGMALQVDATFVYSINKSTFDLTLEDLEDKTNPYNSYTHTGLPPTPIGNPGLESIKAAANPEPTENLYFLTGHDGNMYYATNFDDHVVNKRRYLD